MSESHEELFPDDGIQEIIEGPTLDDKLDVIIEILKKNDKKNEEEHEEIKGRLRKIEQNQVMLQAAYQQHGKMLGEHGEQLSALLLCLNGHNKEQI